MNTLQLHPYPRLACLGALVLVAFCLAAPSSARAQSVIKAEADTFAFAGLPDVLNGSEKVISAKAVNDPKNPISGARKIYLKFSLKGLDKTKITDVALQLNTAPDFSRVGKIGFVLYGVSDRAKAGAGMLGEDWSEDTLTWLNAPANDPANGFSVFTQPGSASVTAAKLASAVAEEGTGEVLAFTSLELVEFIRADTNGTLTLIVTRNAGLASTVNTAFISREGAAELKKPDVAPRLLLTLRR